MLVLKQVNATIQKLPDYLSGFFDKSSNIVISFTLIDDQHLILKGRFYRNFPLIFQAIAVIELD
ncbi:hypothetical protein pb186bvf_005145 [Paramecium bursaria]